MHSIAHIEFNAINLALDAVWRFAGLPEAYYRDWLRVAAEEAKHFGLLQAHLQTLGFAYGDFPAHDGLWIMCEATKDDVVARMALVPRTLEARGLDATPLIQAKLRKVATPAALAAVKIVATILADELGADAADFASNFAALALSPRGATVLGAPVVESVREVLSSSGGGVTAAATGGRGDAPPAASAAAVAALTTLAEAVIKAAGPAAQVTARALFICPARAPLNLSPDTTRPAAPLRAVIVVCLVCIIHTRRPRTRALLWCKRRARPGCSRRPGASAPLKQPRSAPAPPI
jgi:hypothetical protein